MSESDEVNYASYSTLPVRQRLMDNEIYTVHNVIHEDLSKEGHIREYIPQVVGVKPSDGPIGKNLVGFGSDSYKKHVSSNSGPIRHRTSSSSGNISNNSNGVQNTTVFAIGSTVLENKLSSNLHDELCKKLQQHAVQAKSDSTLIHAWKLERFVKVDTSIFNNDGRMSVDINDDMLSATGSVSRLGNSSISLRSSIDVDGIKEEMALEESIPNIIQSNSNASDQLALKKKAQYSPVLEMSTQTFSPVKLNKNILNDHGISQRDIRNLIIGTPMVEPRRNAFLFSMFGLRCIVTNRECYVLQNFIDENTTEITTTNEKSDYASQNIVVSQTNFDLTMFFINAFTQTLYEIQNTGAAISSNNQTYKLGANGRESTTVFSSTTSKAAENSPWEIILLECMLLFLTKQMQFIFTYLSQNATTLMSTLTENKQSAACIFNSVGVLESETTAARSALMSLLDCDRDVASLSFLNQMEIMKMEKLRLQSYSKTIEPNFYASQNLPCPLAMLEDMIESYTAQIYTVSHELKRIEHSLKQKLRHTQLSLDQKRNMMLRYGLMVEMYNVAITATCVINGCLGMNIENPWQLDDDEDPNPLDMDEWLPIIISMFLSFLVGLATFLAFFLPARKKLIAKSD